MKGKTIAVWFSCGAASAVAAKLTVEKYGANNTIRILNNPIKEEHHSWASPKCLKLVKAGLLERNKRGHYRLVTGE